MKAKKARILYMMLHIAIILTACFTLLSIASRIACSWLTKSAYQSCLDISTASPKEERIASYVTGIQLAPQNPAGYLQLIKLYAEDGVFNKQESEAFLSVYNTYYSRIDINDPNYGTLLSEIGFLYANGYEDSPTTRLRMALPFLKQANQFLAEGDSKKRTVSCYCQMGAFYEEYIWDASSVREISDTVMKKMIAEIGETLTYYKTDTSPDAMFNRLGFNVAVCNLLFDQRDVLALTVPYESVVSILNCIYEDLPEAGTLQREQTRQLLATLEDNKQTYYDMIERAYSRKGEA